MTNQTSPTGDVPTVRVLFFSFAAERMKARELTVPIREGTTVRDLFAGWRDRLGAPEDRFVFAVNETWAPPETVLRDGDVLAVIPPVAGG